MSAVYYEGKGSFTVGACRIQPPAPGEVRLDVAYCGVCGPTCTSRTAPWTPASPRRR